MSGRGVGRPKTRKKRVMPAKAGIHDFFAALGLGAAMTLTEKSWMPAFAGMTGQGAGS